MKALLIGGTGTISTAISSLLIEQGWDLTILNRGHNNRRLPPEARIVLGDMNDETQIDQLLKDAWFDVVVDFIAFVPEQVKRDIRLFAHRCSQFIYISSASAYQKPLSHYAITESTPLVNPYWQYSRNKIACEDILMAANREQGFPVTIVRPSHTYGDWSVPLSMHGAAGPWSELLRIRQGKPVIVHGDGSSLWTVTHNTDFAKGFVGLMGNPHAIGEAVHITSDESLTWNQIYQIIGQALGTTPKIVHIATDRLIELKPDLEGPLKGDKSHTVVFDNTKIKRLVPGFCATIRFDQGIRRSLAYIQEHPECQVMDTEWDGWVDQVIADYTRI